ncbi:MAG: hypothetical protein KBD63_08245, partial [Bacteriovoracaceae bacterium]|nr:hypothetical protein [Bacteriovoracaceae bacterium]
MKKHLILITVSGQDGPGITTNIMQTFSAHAVKLKDMGQAVTHGLLSLSFLIETKEPDSLLKDLLFITKKINLHLDFSPFTLSANKSLGQKNESLILSCVSRLDLTPYFLKEMTSILAKHNIN